MFKELNILKPFFEEPSRKFGVREIAKIVEISPATMSKYLKELERKGLLKHIRERNWNLYKGDIENSLYKDLKTFYNLRKLKDSGIIEEINKKYIKPTIILFGSASKGEDVEESDFDIAIICETTKRYILPGHIKKSEEQINRKIQFFIVKETGQWPKYLKNNIFNGIIIQGQLK